MYSEKKLDSSSVKIGVVGCGIMAERHLNAYLKMDGVKVVAVCDINFELAKYIGGKYRAIPYQNYEDLIKDENINAIDVCVPTILHHNVVLNALENNKHVFCEKPLTNKLEYVEQIKEKIIERKKILMTGYLYNFHPSFKRLKLILKEKTIGDPYFAIFRIGGRGSRQIWKHKKDSGGGALLEMMVHMLDLASSYFYPFKEVQTIHYDTILKRRFIESKEIEANAEDCVYLRLRSEKDVEIICEADLITPSYMNYVEVHGDNGSFFGSILDYFPTMIYCKEPKGVYNQGVNLFPNPRVDLIQEELEHFTKVLQGLTEPTDFINKELQIFKIIEEIRRQAGIDVY